MAASLLSRAPLARGRSPTFVISRTELGDEMVLVRRDRRSSHATRAIEKDLDGHRPPRIKGVVR